MPAGPELGRRVPGGPAGLTVRLDRRRFDVIVANLVGDALRHGARRLPSGPLQAGQAGGSELVLEVHDHGPGLPAGAIGRVFDRFYKADSARARSEGSGLGLAIAQENARLHGGRIDAANDPGGGAVFTVRLRCPDQRRRPGSAQDGRPSGVLTRP